MSAGPFRSCRQHIAALHRAPQASQRYGGHAEALLGELQFAFAAFVFGQSLEGALAACCPVSCSAVACSACSWGRAQFPPRALHSLRFGAALHMHPLAEALCAKVCARARFKSTLRSAAMACLSLDCGACSASADAAWAVQSCAWCADWSAVCLVCSALSLRSAGQLCVNGKCECGCDETQHAT